MKLAFPPEKIARWLRYASYGAILIGLASGIIPAFTSQKQTSALGSVGGDAASDMGQMIDIIESMSPGLTGDMGEANSSSADTFKAVEKSGKFIAALQFILPLAYGFMGFVMLQGMATIIEGQQKLSTQLNEQATTSSRPPPPPLKTDM